MINVRLFFCVSLAMLFSCTEFERDNPWENNLLEEPPLVSYEECSDIISGDGNSSVGSIAEFDIIIRDFPASAPGFQENAGCDKVGNGAASVIDFSSRATLNMVASELRYDKEGCPKEDIMGTNGDPDFIRYRYCAYPMTGAANCANSQNWIRSWFDERLPYNNLGSRTNRINDIMELQMNPASNLFEISHTDDERINGYPYRVNWNGMGADYGYFPLDKYSTDPEYAYLTGTDGRPNVEKVFGLENCSAGNNWQQVSPYIPNCVGTPTNHNYGFSIAGSGTFKYVIGDSYGDGGVFEFIGDDDMWIFIDGKLEVDLGGVHLAVAGGISMDNLAAKYGWEQGSMHSINFFYMDRQTPSSNMVLKMSLSDLSPARFGSPRILAARTIASQKSSSTTTIYLNSDLNLETMRQHISNNTFPIVVHKPNSTGILGYKLESIQAEGSNCGAYIYNITGSVCSVSDCSKTQILNSGDYLSFNVKTVDMEGFNDYGFGLTATQDNLYIKSKTNVPANKLIWAKNKTN